MRAPRARATDGAKPACARERSTDSHNSTALRDYGLSIQRQWLTVAVRIGAMEQWLHTSFLERSTAGGAKQPGSLRAKRHATRDYRNSNARDGNLKRKDHD